MTSTAESKPIPSSGLQELDDHISFVSFSAPSRHPSPAVSSSATLNTPNAGSTVLVSTSVHGSSVHRPTAQSTDQRGRGGGPLKSSFSSPDIPTSPVSSCFIPAGETTLKARAHTTSRAGEEKKGSSVCHVQSQLVDDIPSASSSASSSLSTRPRAQWSCLPSIRPRSLSQFEILSSLGEGSFAKVYKVKSKLGGAIYALKVVNVDQARRAHRAQVAQHEAALLARLRHPFVCSLHFFFEEVQAHQHVHCLGLELVLGRNLLELCPLDETTAAFYLTELAVALAYLHQRGVVHRDLKPENLMVSQEDGHLCLLDFGSARLMRDEMLPLLRANEDPAQLPELSALSSEDLLRGLLTEGGDQHGILGSDHIVSSSRRPPNDHTSPTDGGHTSSTDEHRNATDRKIRESADMVTTPAVITTTVSTATSTVPALTCTMPHRCDSSSASGGKIEEDLEDEDEDEDEDEWMSCNVHLAQGISASSSILYKPRAASSPISTSPSTNAGDQQPGAISSAAPGERRRCISDQRYGRHHHRGDRRVQSVYVMPSDREPSNRSGLRKQQKQNGAHLPSIHAGSVPTLSSVAVPNSSVVLGSKISSAGVGDDATTASSGVISASTRDSQSEEAVGAFSLAPQDVAASDPPQKTTSQASGDSPQSSTSQLSSSPAASIPPTIAIPIGRLLDDPAARLRRSHPPTAEQQLFALSLSPSAKVRSYSMSGTAGFIPPETLDEHECSSKSDVWAFGCVLYQMLSGRTPFAGSDQFSVLAAVRQADVDYSDRRVFDEHSIDLLQRIFTMDADSRIGLEGILMHPFLLTHLSALQSVEDWTVEGLTEMMLESDPPPAMMERLRSANTPHSTNVADSRRNSKERSSPILSRQLGVKSTSSIMELVRWQKFLLTDETISYTGVIQKRTGLITRTRQLILTDLPRLFYVDSERMLQKGQIPWSHLLEVEAKGGRRFDVITPARTYYLESDQVDEWLYHIRKMKASS